jgi:hypothetical protein
MGPLVNQSVRQELQDSNSLDKIVSYQTNGICHLERRNEEKFDKTFYEYTQKYRKIRSRS